MLRFGLTISTLVLALAACAPSEEPENTNEAPGSATAETVNASQSFHESIAVLDSHLDTPRLFHDPDYDFKKRGSWEENRTHVDLPRMNEGGLDGGFWVIYTPQGPLTEEGYQAARNHALMRQTAIREFAAKYHNEVALAFSADDAERILAEGKKVVFQSMENAYPLGTDISLLEHFYIGGLRMVSPAHFAHNQFSDSATDPEEVHAGLSPEGEKLIEEANRLGMILDGSHTSDQTTRDMIALSKTPIILSHTGADAIYDHPRNIPDDLLIELAESGGVIQMNIFGAYLEKLEPSAERAAAQEKIQADLITQYGSMSDVPRSVAQAAFFELNAMHPAPRSTYEKFMEHTYHVLDLIGPEHVGISGDWDGGGGVDGMSDASMFPRITEDLLEAGYSEEDVMNIWGGNMMRLMRAAEAARTSDLTSPDILN